MLLMSVFMLVLTLVCGPLCAGGASASYASFRNARRELERLFAARRIQRAIRRFLRKAAAVRRREQARIDVRVLRSRRRRASTHIQRFWRGCQGRRRYRYLQRRRAAATHIQASWRRFVARRWVELWLRPFTAAVTIQCAMRQRGARLELRQRRQLRAATTIQALWRGAAIRYAPRVVVVCGFGCGCG